MSQSAISQKFANPNTAPFLPAFHAADVSANWSSGSGWAADETPALIAYGGNGNLPAVSPGASGTSDYGGCREAHMYVETINGVETWFLFYGAGDGTNATTGQWRPQLATSTNRGRSWSKLGPLNIELQAGDGVTPYSRDMLYMEKRGSNYYLYSMKGLHTSTASDRGPIPCSPYVADQWVLASSGNGPVGNWTYLGDATLQGTSGSIDDFSSYMNSVVASGSEYVMFLNVTQDDSETSNVEILNISYATAPSPAGPWTKSNTVLYTSAISPYAPENPKVFYHPFLGLWCMSVNELVPNQLGAPDRNSMYTSPALTSGWNFSTRRIYMHISPMDGNYAVGLITPFYNPEGVPTITQDGYMPICYDTNPYTGSFPDIHTGRQILYSVLEPSRTRLKYTPVSSGTAFSDSFTAGTVGEAINGENSWTTLDTSGGPAEYIGTPLFSDNFVAQSGGAIGGVNGWITVDTNGGTPSYVGNAPTQGVSLGTSVGESLIYNSGTSSLNPTVMAMLTLAAQCSVGIVLRYQSSSTFYNVDLNLHSDGNLWATLYANESAIGSAISTGAYVAAQAVTVSLSGSTFTIQNGANAAVTLTDSNNTITVAGYCGLRNGGGESGQRTVTAFLVTQGTADALSLGSNAGETLVYNTSVSSTTSAVSADLTIDASCSVGFALRYTSTSSFYNIDIGRGDGAASSPSTELYATLFANESQIYPASGQGESLGTYSPGITVTVTQSGNTFTVQAGSNPAVVLTDANSTITSAGYCGLRNGGGVRGSRIVQSYAIGGSSTPTGTYVAQANSNFVAEYAIDMIDAPAGGTIGFDFRVQSSGNCYRLKCAAGGGLSLYTEVNGIETELGTPTGSQVTAQIFPCRIRVKAMGTAIQAWLNGEEQINVTDSTFSSGVKLGFVAGTNTFGIRNLSLYPSDTITVGGLVEGQAVTLRAPGGPPVATQTAVGATVSFTQSHYPMGSIDIDGVDHVIEGGIWGGDSYNFAPQGRSYSFS